MQTYHISGIYDNLIKNNAFEVIKPLIEKRAIDTDVYEYDRFNQSIFSAILKNLGTDEDAIGFLEEFISQVENINDELEGKTWLSLALENEADPNLAAALTEQGCDAHLN